VNSKVKEVLRWIAVVPAAIASLIFSYALMYLMWRWNFQDAFCGLLKVAWVEAIAKFVGSAFSGAFFVAAGAYTAPRRHGETALGLCGLLLVITGFSFAGVLITREWVSALYIVVTTVSAVCAGVAIFTEESQKRSQQNK
jgi:hypothetical protein